MIKDERVLELIEIIKKKKRIAVKELAEITFSSTSTLRRDLIFLENQGLIKRKHGYVTLSSMNTIELSHQIREGESTRQKRLIASLAKDFIRSGMCIYLDSSTTVYELCPYLSELDNLIIFTNGLHTAQTLSETVTPNYSPLI
ncbi:regulator of fucose operon [Streptococcus pneumoniae]|nr:regulator of fucose operon [Streptococcus pneumoniae]VLJ87866.1 regulator of fucose operon [Streptococcus pneumoniae]VNR22651.1 regulator of fucose operon [Streptococcus pneumoniae]VRK70302.1 regulator of fucose operon [Streptococcus pneumoniae]